MEGCNEICLAGMGGRVPTWRMVAGSSTESLALDVALQCQVPADIVQRAAYLFKVSVLPSRAVLSCFWVQRLPS